MPNDGGGVHPKDCDRDESAAPGLLSDALQLLGSAWRLDPRRLIAQVALLLLTGFTGGVSMLMLIPIVNSVADGNDGMSVTISIPVLDSADIADWPLGLLLITVVLLVAGQALLVRASAINAVRLQQKLVDSLRSTAFEAILHARWSFILDTRRSDITEIATSGAARSGAAFNALLQGAVSAAIGIATAVVSLIVAPALTAFILLGMAAFAFVLSRSLRPAHSLGRQFGTRNRLLQGVMLDSLDSLRLVRAHGGEATWADQLTGAFADTRAVQLASVRRTSRVAATATIGLVAFAALVVFVAVEMAVPAATIVVVLVLAARLSQSVRGIATSLQTAASTLPAVADLGDLTRRATTAAELPSSSTPRDLPAAQSGPLVSLRNVTYHYAGSGEGITGIDVEIPRGSITAFTGPSGAGKSTTADLVLGLLRPDEGEILVDGVPLTPEVLTAWRRKVAYVPQETVLIPGSVRWNLTWAAGRSVTDADCESALRSAAADFIFERPGGLDGEVGDRGAGLSGGQRQRIAIARALVRAPDLLVLDEATSSLDDETETEVMRIVNDLTPEVTVLVIAHRRSTIEAADYVVHFDRGRVTHAGRRT